VEEGVHVHSITTEEEDGVVMDGLHGMMSEDDAEEAGAAGTASTLTPHTSSPEAAAAPAAGTVALTVRVVGFTLQLYEMSAAAAAAARLLEVKLGLSLQLETGATGLALSAGLTGIPYRSNPSPQNEHTANCVDWSPPGVSLCSFVERVVDSMLKTPVRFPYEW